MTEKQQLTVLISFSSLTFPPAKIFRLKGTESQKQH